MCDIEKYMLLQIYTQKYYSKKLLQKDTDIVMNDRLTELQISSYGVYHVLKVSSCDQL